MKYRVVFRARNNQEGESSDNPPQFLDTQLEEGIVHDAALVTRNDPDSNHSGDGLEEDDDFLSLGTEVWDYDIADGKDEEFMAAVQKSRMVIEFEPLDED